MSHPHLAGASIRTVAYGDGRQTAIVFACATCDAEFVQRYPSGRPSPEHAQKRAQKAGWLAYVDRTGADYCPSCIAARRSRAHGDKPESKQVEPLMENSVVTVTPIKHAPTQQTSAREPTQQERLRIRNKLDAQFDDAAGCYLDGWSDQRVGEELNIPWAIVTRIREAAYGPIRVDPELAALRAELVGLGTKIDALMKQQYGLVERVATFERKRGAA